MRASPLHVCLADVCSTVRILVLSNVVPYPPHGGVHLRILNILQRVAQRHDVTLGCHSWGDADLDGAAWLNRNGVRTITAPLLPANWRHAAPALQAALFRGQPPEIVQYQAPKLHALIAQERFDILQVEETLLAPYASSLPSEAGTKTILVFHNMHFMQEERIAALEGKRLDRLWRRANAQIMRRYEPAIAARFDRNIAVSAVDRALLRGLAPDLEIDVLANGVDTAALRPLPPPDRKRSLIFVGTLNYKPCVDAVLWLAQEVLPILRRRRPDLELWIVGKLPPPEVEALAGPGVFVTGYVEDLTPYYQRSAVAVVPLRAGGGSRLKILEAMALGRPVVSTAVGAEGLEVTAEQNILLAESAEAFAVSVERLLNDDDLWRSIVQRAREFVEIHHEWDKIVEQQLKIYDELMQAF